MSDLIPDHTGARLVTFYQGGYFVQPVIAWKVTPEAAEPVAMRVTGRGYSTRCTEIDAGMKQYVWADGTIHHSFNDAYRHSQKLLGVKGPVRVPKGPRAKARKGNAAWASRGQ